METPGVTAAIARVREIQAQFAPPAASQPAQAFASALSGAITSPAAGSQATMALAGSRAGAPLTAGTPSAWAGTPAWTASAIAPPSQVGTVAIGPGTPVGTRIAQLAAAEMGVAEEPPGSNDGGRIAEYRTATQGAGVGPWCSYFTSWLAAQAGVPVGDGGQGFGWVPDVTEWGQRTGRFVPADGGVPAVGDLVIFDRNSDGLDDHIGVVTYVRPDGSFETVEGNSSDRVSARSYGAGAATGFVRLG